VGKRKNSLYLVQVLIRRRPIQKEMIGLMFIGVTKHVMLFITISNYRGPSHIPNSCLYLFIISPNKETMVKMSDIPENICQGLKKIPKIMKNFVGVAGGDTNNHKYRLFHIFLYLSCKAQLNLLYNRLCFSYNFFRS
jgi:hypothetical protein